MSTQRALQRISKEKKRADKAEATVARLRRNYSQDLRAERALGRQNQRAESRKETVVVSVLTAVIGGLFGWALSRERS